MNKKTTFKTLVLGAVLPVFLWATAETAQAQRGLPPKKKTVARHVTKYPMHLDFLPDMVKLLKVPEGWEVKVAASGLGMPRMICEAPGGGLYITRRDAADVLLLKDSDSDGMFDEVRTVVYPFKTVHGIAAKDGYLYLCGNRELKRCKINADGTLSEPEMLIDDLPSGGQHPNRTIAFGPDGMLYISIGTLCNDCKEADPEVAAMLRVDPKTWKREIFASGLRNTIGFDFHPTTGELWGIDNGGDGKGNHWPPEEVNRIVKNGNYGYPLVYGKREVDQSREDPAGDTKEAFAKSTEPSVLELPAHMAPIGYTFFGNANNIPADYSDDGLVCWHGSWNSSKPVGFRVDRIRFENGVAVGSEPFLSGFLKPGFLMFKRKARFGRPAGVLVTDAGTVYITDDANGYFIQLKEQANEKSKQDQLYRVNRPGRLYSAKTDRKD